MMNLLSKPLFLPSVAFICLPLFCLAQVDSVAIREENQRDLQRYQSQLEEFESEFGPFDNRLLEPIASMVNIHSTQGNFERVSELQSRQLSIMRTELGFENPDLIPFLRSMIEVQRVLGNWDTVSDHLEHLRYLSASNYGSESEELLNAMENQTQWLLARFYLDEERRQSKNFLNAREIYRDMYRLAERIHGDEDPALYPWYYKRAYNLAILVQLLNTDDSLSGELLRDVIRSDGPSRLEYGRRGGVFSRNRFFDLGQPLAVVDGDSVLGEGYLRQGIGYINDIQSIAKELGDLETEAMADLYRGDFNILMERGSGRRQYNESREKLLAAGINQADIDEFFSVPMPLPIPDFYARFADLVAYKERIIGDVEDLPEGTVHLGTFRAWHKNARAVLKPISKDPLLRIGLPQFRVDLEFNISSQGNVSSVDVLSSIPEDRRVRIEASRAMREIKFRPAYEGNRARRIHDVRIRYFFAQQ